MYQDSKSEVALRAREKFESMISAGNAQAAGFFQRLADEAPKDFIVSTKSLDFGVEDDRLIVQTPEHRWHLHRNAMNQMVQKTNILTGGVADKMFEAVSESEKWGRDLLLQNLKTMYQKTERERVLVRVVDGEVRGFLSDKYRRLNSAPIIEAFALKAQKFGAVPIVNHDKYRATYYTDIKIGFTLFLPCVFEPVPNEVILIGLSVESSDFGAASLTMRLLVMRITCINMMVLKDELRKVHLGARLPDEIRFSDETYRSDTQTMALAIGDMTESCFNPDVIHKRIEAIRVAATTQIDAARVYGDLRRSGLILKGDEKEISDLYNTADIELMPAGGTMWRASQAIALFANKLEDKGQTERAIDMRHAAGVLIDQVNEAAQRGL